jgi:hypothetical protein
MKNGFPVFPVSLAGRRYVSRTVPSTVTSLHYLPEAVDVNCVEAGHSYQEAALAVPGGHAELTDTLPKKC